jgi:hypothetical protein
VQLCDQVMIPTIPLPLANENQFHTPRSTKT